MPYVPVTRRMMRYPTANRTPVLPFKFRWTPETEDGMIALYLLGVPNGANRQQTRLRAHHDQAQGWVCNRLNVLKSCVDYHRKIHSRGGHRTTIVACKWEI